LAWVFIQIHKRLPFEASSDIALTLIEPYLMYWLAEEFHASGVLAVVCGGLLMSTKRLFFLNSTSRIQAFSAWGSFVFILNGSVFLIIGLELPEIVEGLRTQGVPLSTAIGYGLLVTAVLVIVRMISAYSAMIATFIFRRGVFPQSKTKKRTLLVPLLLGWTGMRGVVSLAAALAIPITLDNGAAFPQRNLILFITFVTILSTLLVQGLTLPYLIKRWHLFDDLMNEESEEQTKQKMKQGLKKHIYAFLKNKQEHELKEHAGIEKILKEWEERIKSDESGMSEKNKALFLEVLESQREYLTELNKDPKIDEEIIRRQLYQIDLEEERLRVI
jgi:NhaP-type Na+/H+ or K+/H+ antiporter